MAIYNKTIGVNSYFNGTDFGGATLVGGDTVLWDVGSHVGTQYFNGYHGSLGNPIVFDLNGQSIDSNLQTYGARFVNCSYIIFTNGEVINTTLVSNGGAGVYTAESWAVSIIMVNASGHGGAGLRGGFQSKETNSAKWRVNFSDPYFNVIGCTVHDVGTEAIYGNTSNAQLNRFVTSTLVPWQDSFCTTALFSMNTTYNSGYDGIQVGAVQGKVTCNYNLVYNYASLDIDTHDNGIQIGTGSHGECYNNTVHTSLGTKGAMYNIQGDGVLFFNNLGYDGFTGIYVSSTYTSPNRVTNIFNNTFVDIKLHSIYYNTRTLRNMKLYNNIFHRVAVAVPPTTYEIREVNNPDYVQSNNIFTDGATSKTNLFTDAGGGDYTLKVGSAAIAAGLNLSSFTSKLLLTKTNTIRPTVGVWNCGAF